MPQVIVSREAESTLASPTDEQFSAWVKLALQSPHQNDSVYIGFVTAEEIQSLNHQYRHKNKPTNILSFPFETPPGVPNSHLGDLVICPSIVQDEALTQGKTLESHWAHLILHGTLHLQGYDHEQADDATIMEQLEIQLLAHLGYPNPYRSK